MMPEYGRNVQKMIDYVSVIPDRDKRNEQIKAVVAVMGILNPQLRDLVDYRHKLWDHVQVIADFNIDIDSPYPTPTKEMLAAPPCKIPLERTRLKAAHYGRNIQNMLEIIASRPDDEVKVAMIKTIGEYMRQQYLIWNKDSVLEETIFKDINLLSSGRIIVPADLHLSNYQPEVRHSQSLQTRSSNSAFRGVKKKRWKKNGNI